MDDITEQQFQVVQTAGSFRNDIGEMSEMQVYAHIRTRLGDNMEATENVLRELQETGRATARFNDSFGRDLELNARNTKGPCFELPTQYANGRAKIWTARKLDALSQLTTGWV